MPKVTFKTDNITVEVPVGTRLVDVADEVEATLPFGCRDGLCGTCIMTILEGAGSLQPMSEDERETLENYEATDSQRLGCQAEIRGDLVIENP